MITYESKHKIEHIEPKPTQKNSSISIFKNLVIYGGLLGSNTCMLDGIEIEYCILDDPTRNVEYGVDYWCDQSGLVYTSPDWKGPGL